MKTEISPFTGGKSIECTSEETFTFRGEEFTITRRFYKCLDTGHKYSTGEQDDEAFYDILRQYEEKHGK